MIKRLASALRPRPRLSIVVIMYDMAREAERTLHSLSRHYQWGIDHFNYEVIVVDNGSPSPLEESFVENFGEQFRLLYIEDAYPSPASAINFGVSRARGDILCIMIDGAHVLTPGILHYADLAFSIYRNPVVTPHYFFVGPGQQSRTVQSGYNQSREDCLFESIHWPRDGYRLFEIGQIIGESDRGWFMEKFECNCLFLSKDHFDACGGMDERFDLPGGGFANLDLYARALTQPGLTAVGLLGEGTFHQIHGGDTTNSSGQERVLKINAYRQQFLEIHGHQYMRPKVNTQYLGHMPSLSARIDSIS